GLPWYAREACFPPADVEGAERLLRSLVSCRRSARCLARRIDVNVHVKPGCQLIEPRCSSGSDAVMLKCDGLPITAALDALAVVRLAEGLRLYRQIPGCVLILILSGGAVRGHPPSAQ